VVLGNGTFAIYWQFTGSITVRCARILRSTGLLRCIDQRRLLELSRKSGGLRHQYVRIA
jgi:hypothetical protein